MLHFAGGIALRMNIGNFLQLQRAFEGDREMDAASEVEKIGRLEKLAGQIFIDPVIGQNRLQFARNHDQFMDKRARFLFATDVRAPAPDTSPEWPAQSADT